jgi:hypothetical protein
MIEIDDFTQYHHELLEGVYDCIDRIVVNGYFPLGQEGGGLRTWWKKLTGSDASLDTTHLKRMAGSFSRKIHAYAKKKAIPLIHCTPGVRKHELAEEYLPADPHVTGVFLILVAKAPGLVWEVKKRKNNIHLQRKTPWPYVNHYHFHIIDREWGHLTIKMSGHPPFNVQIMLNGHEWVERQARKKTVSLVKEGNCFVGGSDFMTLGHIADTLGDHHLIGRLARVCDRWVYSSCLCFALDTEEQRASEFHYRYSCYQLEYSRNLLFERGTMLDRVYQGCIDRTRRVLDVKKFKTIFGWKYRPHHRTTRCERILDASRYDLTVFKITCGGLSLKMYDKGDRVLRIEAIAHNVKDLRCGKRLEKLSDMLAKLKRMAFEFLNVICAAHINYLDAGILEDLPKPTQRGTRRLAGVDLQKPRIRSVSEAVLSLAVQPDGFTIKDLAQKVSLLNPGSTYTPRHASYDLLKLRGKELAEPIANSRRYRCPPSAIRILAGTFILSEKVIKPILSGVCTKRLGRPKTIHPIDGRYDAVRREMFTLLQELHLAA